MKHIICFSGGHASAVVAIEVERKFGKENMILLNHDISPRVENQDIKRFKKEVADYLGLPITYANYNDLPVDELPDQFDVVELAGSFVNPYTREALCTNRLKTAPFKQYLDTFFKDKSAIVYYGFDSSEPNRVERRASILAEMGFESDYPLMLWGDNYLLFNDYLIDDLRKVHNVTHKSKLNLEQYKVACQTEIWMFLDSGLVEFKKPSHERTIQSTLEIGIEKPLTYGVFKHANCEGCLKAGQQHWYCVYVYRRDIWERGKLSEHRLGHSIINGYFLKDLESKFQKMLLAGIEANEHIPFQTFWAKARKFLKDLEIDKLPCECSY